MGVDTIAAHSGVVKTSRYRWCPTKDDLIAAVLEQENGEFRAYRDKFTASTRGNRERSLSLTLAGDISGPKFRGCPFLTAGFLLLPAAGRQVRA